jgi:hypothetical protein
VPDPPPLSLDTWVNELVDLPRGTAQVVGLAKKPRAGEAPTHVLGCQAAAALVIGAPLVELNPAAANAKST